MEKNAKIYVAGHTGLAGSAIYRCLTKNGYTNILTRTHAQLDLIRQKDVEQFFEKEKPEYVFIAAARVGGIWANDHYPAEFLYENMMIETNIINAAYHAGVKKLLFLGSSCIYPRECPQPMKEEYLMTGPLEPTNQWYAIAKIAGIKLCVAYNKEHATNYLCVMPCNLYGPGDNYDPQNAHVIPMLIRRFHEAKERGDSEVAVWGTGKPLREFLHSDDLADACVFLMENKNATDIGEFINVGAGEEITIKDLAQAIKEVVGFEGKLVFDESKPDGTERKIMDCSRMRAFGWSPQVQFEQGLADAYEDFKKHRK